MKIFVLTGAGISAESGLGTFRDKNGLWTKYDLAEVATPEGFARNPDLVRSFYNARRKNCLGAEPNAAHRALARLGAAPDVKLTLVTQNVDDLHERAGSADVLHMHGTLLGNLCHVCAHRWPGEGEIAADDPCPSCRAPAVRPDVVWFGEIPYHMEAIETALGRADLFVSIGTSGEVYPAAGFVATARALGLSTLELNLEPSAGTGLFDAARHGPATEVVPAWVAELLSPAP
ncbi:MAG: NAD-dependent deacylase [Pseudomonadota bacterium]